MSTDKGRHLQGGQVSREVGARQRLTLREAVSFAGGREISRWHGCWCCFQQLFMVPIFCGRQSHSFPCFLPVYSDFFLSPSFLFFSIHNLRGSPLLETASGAFIYLIYLDRGFYKFGRRFWVGLGVFLQLFSCVTFEETSWGFGFFF